MEGQIHWPSRNCTPLPCPLYSTRLLRSHWSSEAKRADTALCVARQDLIIFPDEAVFKKVKQCTTGRVFLLEWKSTERRLFFWMQEPSDEKDAELCEKVNKALNSPPAAEGAHGNLLLQHATTRTWLFVLEAMLTVRFGQTMQEARPALVACPVWRE